MKKNIALLTDSYKFSHHLMLPEGVEWMTYYMESRGGRFPVTQFTGAQIYMLEYLIGLKITEEAVEYADMRVTKHMGPGIFNKAGWMRIAKEFGGALPLRIRAVKEGAIVPVKNVLMTMEPTHPDFCWLPGHFETLLMKIWSPITVGTTSLVGKHIIRKYLKKNGDESGLFFKLHDFGDRGVSSVETAAIAGLAHLVNFMGTDTFQALEAALEYYECDMAGFSIPATEHSYMTILGRDGEYKQMERFLNVYANFAIKACVSDSYNIYEAIKFWGTQKQKLIDQKAILVVRPDSGDPATMSVECVERLDKEFGSTVNEKGYKVLNHVRVIYGDGISNTEVIEQILFNLDAIGYSADNIAFGMGGGLLQKNDRDTQKFAIKCSAAIINGKLVDVQKDPITDQGKKSKAGILDLIKDENGQYKTVNITLEQLRDPNHKSELVTIFENGEIKVKYNLDEIRAKAEEDYQAIKHLI
jgi:nicotinamide phosphoribosyltransferase